MCCFHTLPSSQEQVAAVFKGHGAAPVSPSSAVPAPTPATTVLKGKVGFCYYIRIEGQEGAQRPKNKRWHFHSSPNPRPRAGVICELDSWAAEGVVPGRQREILVMHGSSNWDEFRAAEQRTLTRGGPEELEPLVPTFENLWRPSGTWEKRRLSISFKNGQDRDFPGGMVAKTLHLPMQGAWVRSMVRELDPTCCN